MLLEDIEAKLKQIDTAVDYGMVKRYRAETEWNYIVFNRVEVRFSTQKTSASDAFEVHIVRENYVPDGMEDSVVALLEELPGVRVAGNGTFEYVSKPNTDCVVEMLTIPFVRARKR